MQYIGKLWKQLRGSWKKDSILEQQKILNFGNPRSTAAVVTLLNRYNINTMKLDVHAFFLVKDSNVVV